MKQVHPAYSFVASTKTITLTGLNIDQDQLLLIVNATRGVQYFNFADSSLRAAVTAGANTTVVLTDASTTGHANGDALVIYYDDQAASQVVSGTVTANPGAGAFTVSGTVGLDSASLIALENVTVTVSAAVSVSNFPSTQTVAGTVTVGASSVTFNAYIGQRGDGSWQPISLQSGSNYVNANVENSVTIGSLPAISGTVTANLSSSNLNAVTVGIRGVVTASINGSASATSRGPITTVDDNVPADPKYMMSVGGIDYSSNQWRTFNLDGGGRSVVTVSNFPATQAVSLASTTVTVSALPGGALTTRFGSVTTANTAQMTSAVTNTSRKYLLAQNISAGTVTIGIGFSPTTTQGIQLTAGGGLTFDAFCPTGAVYWLGAVTGAAFTILEG